MTPPFCRDEGRCCLPAWLCSGIVCPCFFFRFSSTCIPATCIPCKLEVINRHQSIPSTHIDHLYMANAMPSFKYLKHLAAACNAMNDLTVTRSALLLLLLLRTVRSVTPSCSKRINQSDSCSMARVALRGNREKLVPGNCCSSFIG